MRKFLSAIVGFFKKFFSSAARQKLAEDAIKLAEFALPIVQRFAGANGVITDILAIAASYGHAAAPPTDDTQATVKKWIGDIVSEILQEAFPVGATQAQIARDVAYLNVKPLSAAEQSS